LQPRSVDSSMSKQESRESQDGGVSLSAPMDVEMLEESNTRDQYSSRAADMLADLTLGDSDRELVDDERSEKFEKFLAEMGIWSEGDQVSFAKRYLVRMSHTQLGRIDRFLRPMLQRDFVAHLPSALAEHVLLSLDAHSLAACEGVSGEWRRKVAVGQLWRKIIEQKVKTDEMWKGLSEKKNWKKFLMCSREMSAQIISECLGLCYSTLKGTVEMTMHQHAFYRRLYPKIVQDIRSIDNNWRTGTYTLKRINCRSENSKGVYCLQYDDDKIVSGLRDNTIKVWDRETLECRKTLTGHTGSVLCLQYDEQVIISGSSDATVRVWNVLTGECLNTLIHHCEAVLHLRFHNGIMVTCSKDRSIAVWTMVSPKEINLRRVLLGHRAAVNVVDFDNTFIVSASGDRTIKVWSADSCEYIRTLSGHKRGIACLQYRDRLVVSGSSDNTIRLWNILCGACLRVLEGHEELVRCIRFDSKRIVSGAYDGKIKVWDLQAAMDPRSLPGTLCLATLTQHTGRVFRLQFDDFQIVSSSHDDTILIWDFLDAEGASGAAGAGGGAAGDGPPAIEGNVMGPREMPAGMEEEGVEAEGGAGGAGDGGAVERVQRRQLQARLREVAAAGQLEGENGRVQRDMEDEDGEVGDIPGYNRPEGRREREM
ncbi:hypothetical protein PENTCL1PPCAC_27310, partial [Pristionchus entomophagus]